VFSRYTPGVIDLACAPSGRCFPADFMQQFLGEVLKQSSDARLGLPESLLRLDITPAHGRRASSLPLLHSEHLPLMIKIYGMDSTGLPTLPVAKGLVEVTPADLDSESGTLIRPTRFEKLHWQMLSRPETRYHCSQIVHSLVTLPTAAREHASSIQRACENVGYDLSELVAKTLAELPRARSLTASEYKSRLGEDLQSIVEDPAARLSEIRSQGALRYSLSEVRPGEALG
jgi:hypothetical protein